MKKLIALTLAALFIGAGVAGATDFTLTGSYFVRGQWVDNWDGTGRDAVDKKNQYGVYDHELSLDANWQISDATKVFARFEIRDENWAVASNPTESTYGGGAPDDNIYVERVWGQHTFADSKTTVKAGLMGTSAWASNFYNDGDDAYRIMISKETAFGRFIAYTEKPQEGAAAETEEEDMDTDSYAVALVSDAAGITWMPKVTYTDNEAADFQAVTVDFGATGTFNNIGFEAELVYADYNYELATDDYAVWGAYGNVWTQLDALKLGAFIAYGSYDEDVDKGFRFGDDFTAGGAAILGDELFMYVSPGSKGEDLQAVTLLAAYASYAVSEKLTLGAYLGYADSNVDNPGTAFDGASAWEANVNGSYKLSDNVTYSAGAAMAQLEYGNNTADPDEAIELFHKLAFSF